MAYSYSNGDGVAVLLVTEPDGATEPVSVLDQAVRQIKSYLNDPTEGPDAKVSAIVNPTKVVATHSGGQAIAAGAGITPIEFDTEDLDANGDFNNATYKFTAPVDGLYLVIAALTVQTAASSTPTAILHQLDMFIDGTSSARTRLSRGTDETDADMQLTRMLNLSAGQTVWMKYTLTVGSGTMSVDVVADPRETIFQVTKIFTTDP
jgi:hypothetical protein